MHTYIINIRGSDPTPDKNLDKTCHTINESLDRNKAMINKLNINTKEIHKIVTRLHKKNTKIATTNKRHVPLIPEGFQTSTITDIS